MRIRDWQYWIDIRELDCMRIAKAVLAGIALKGNCQEYLRNYIQQLAGHSSSVGHRTGCCNDIGGMNPT